ncbi:MAG: hypothetical protein AMJ70_07125 [Dehalococcoidia bacterium SG8_51_3]|nr:MAG: hypothetical protein AMJ70_07125 [Dehalococcoidia bacterium SG8_51_3]
MEANYSVEELYEVEHDLPPEFCRYRDEGCDLAASKRTEPFKTARQYDILKMNQSSEYQALVESIKSDGRIMAEIQAGTRAGAESDGMRLAEVKQKYGL